MALVERLLDRDVLANENGPIPRNRQPGRCCVSDCQVPGAPVMVEIPAMVGKAEPRLVVQETGSERKVASVE